LPQVFQRKVAQAAGIALALLEQFDDFCGHDVRQRVGSIDPKSQQGVLISSGHCGDGFRLKCFSLKNPIDGHEPPPTTGTVTASPARSSEKSERSRPQTPISNCWTARD